MKKRIRALWAIIMLKALIFSTIVKIVYRRILHLFYCIFVNPIQAHLKARRLVRDYPDNWDRYCKIKEIEHETEATKTLVQAKSAAIDFTGSVTRFKIFLIVLVAYQSGEKVNSTYEEIQSGIEKSREEITSAIQNLSSFDIAISDELKNAIYETPLQELTDRDKLTIFLNQFKELTERDLKIPPAS